MQIFEFENFVEVEDCKAIAHYLKANKKAEKNKEGFFDNITIPYNKVGNTWVKRRMSQFRFDATMQAIVSFNKKLYPNYTDLVHWPIGKKMEIHGDSHYLDGREGLFPYRLVSGVLYLNDNYEGGETFFPKQECVIKPKTGKLILFPSDLEYPHGVTEVKSSERFTMPIWFTQNTNNIEF